ncbi:MAG: helix-turn-helix domain-containing protein, partial [Ktedonobacteraceae bacterium]|nr:helix-turn-helix domain-containing protein [Ktedonobacteraceae bacterium]
MEDYPILLTVQQAARKCGKSEKTMYRWIESGKLQATKHAGGGWLIKREDLAAVTDHVTVEWENNSRLLNQDFRIAMLESSVEDLRARISTQERTIARLERQVKQLQPKKATKKRA